MFEETDRSEGVVTDSDLLAAARTNRTSAWAVERELLELAHEWAIRHEIPDDAAGLVRGVDRAVPVAGFGCPPRF